MADKEKKISIASFDKVLKEQAVPNTTEHWFGNEVVIKHTISIAQMLAFVDNVVSSCFHDEGYMPEVKDLLIKSNLLTRYANFTLPENLEHRYTLIYNTDAVAMVSKHISSAQFDEILRAIDEKSTTSATPISWRLRSRCSSLRHLLRMFPKRPQRCLPG